MSSGEEWTDEEGVDEFELIQGNNEIIDNDASGEPILTSGQIQMLKSLSLQLNLTFSESISILKENKWSAIQLTEKILNFELDNNKNSVVASETNYYSCKSCQSMLYKADVIFMQCRHFLCYKCLKIFFIVSFSCRDNDGGVKCPFDECNTYFTKSIIENYLKQLNIRKISSFENFYNIITLEDSEKLVDIMPIKNKCNCVYLFCHDCSRENHRPLSCKQASNWHQVLFNYSQNWEFDTKCPRCSCEISQNKYCKQIKCTCGFQFCYNCHNEFKDQSILHKCTIINRINFEIKENITEFSLLKHYTLCLNLKESLIQDEKNYITALASVNFIYNYNKENLYLNFYYKAAKLVYKSRRSLIFASIAGYFINSPSKHAFYSYIMEEMKALLNKLSGLLDFKLLVDFNADFYSESFFQYKTSVNDLIHIVKNTFDKYFNCIEAGFPEVEELEHVDVGLVNSPEKEGEDLSIFYYDDWTCHDCSFVNEVFSSKCDFCASERLIYG